MASGAQTSSSAFAPFLIEPRFVGRVWGFNDLRPWYDRVAGSDPATPGREAGQPIGEVWLTGDECRVATGPHAGKTLAELFVEAPQAMLGCGASLPGANEPASGLSYLFAAAGSARLMGSGSEPIELPSCGIVAVLATSPAFTVENLGGLDLIRISPRWPGTAQ
jgi:hypothetical protein